MPRSPRRTPITSHSSQGAAPASGQTRTRTSRSAGCGGGAPRARSAGPSGVVPLVVPGSGGSSAASASSDWARRAWRGRARSSPRVATLRVTRRWSAVTPTATTTSATHAPRAGRSRRAGALRGTRHGVLAETTRTASTLASKRRASSGCLRSARRAMSIGGSALPRPCSRRTSSPSEMPVMRNVTRSSRSPSGKRRAGRRHRGDARRPTTAAAAVSSRVTSDGPPAGGGLRAPGPGRRRAGEARQLALAALDGCGRAGTGRRAPRAPTATAAGEDEGDCGSGHRGALARRQPGQPAGHDGAPAPCDGRRAA